MKGEFKWASKCSTFTVVTESASVAHGEEDTLAHTLRLRDIKSEFLSNRYWQGKTQSDTHAHTRLDYLLSVSVITDLTSFLHVKADKPFVHARAHTHKFCTSPPPPAVSSDGNCWRARRWPAGEILIGAESAKRGRDGGAKRKSSQFKGQMCRSGIPLPSESSTNVMRQLGMTHLEGKWCLPDASSNIRKYICAGANNIWGSSSWI